VKYVLAKTHGAEYSWHKYWSRKPANVIAAYLREIAPKGGFVVDPFSGSGVVLRESIKLGLTAQAFDVNPVAVSISSLMVSKIEPENFLRASNQLLDQAESELGHTYSHKGRLIRFLVHKVVTKCLGCGLENVYSKETHGTNGKKCLECKAKLSFGLSSLARTDIEEIIYLDGSSSSSAEDLSAQYSTSQNSDLQDFRFSLPLVDNRRTLTSSEISTKSFFTPRNFWILSKVAELAHREQDPELKNALLLMITGSSAQASRLIASRGSLARGGQAWTIPGFWVPPIHLESNPFVHLRARAKKIYSALVAMDNYSTKPGSGSVSHVSAREGLLNVVQNGRKADVIFLDPPYGDSVAFMEFSAIWNGFLQSEFDYSDDISVSDRVQNPMTQSSYERMLTEIVEVAGQALDSSGKILLTFNNHDMRAWRGIIHALGLAGFSATSVSYQDPAVVSTKSQKSINGSYVGDFYVVFDKEPKEVVSLSDVAKQIADVLAKSAAIRGGSLSKGLAFRILVHESLLRNLDPGDFANVEELLDKVFHVTDGKYVLKASMEVSEIFQDKAAKILYGLDLSKEAALVQLSKLAEEEFKDCGIPSLLELLPHAPDFKRLDQLW
jgi:hypothetical protein